MTPTENSTFVKIHKEMNEICTEVLVKYHSIVNFYKVTTEKPNMESNVIHSYQRGSFLKQILQNEIYAALQNDA